MVGGLAYSQNTSSSFESMIMDRSKIPIEILKRQLKINEFHKPEYKTCEFQGAGEIEYDKNIMLFMISIYNKKHERTLVYTIKKGKIIDYEIFYTTCYICSKNDLFADIKFLGKKKQILIVQYYKPIFKKGIIDDSEKKFQKKEKFIIKSSGKITPLSNFKNI
jgi:hypothetical protein